MKLKRTNGRFIVNSAKHPYFGIAMQRSIRWGGGTMRFLIIFFIALFVTGCAVTPNSSRGGVDPIFQTPDSRYPVNYNDGNARLDSDYQQQDNGHPIVAAVVGVAVIAGVVALLQHDNDYDDRRYDRYDRHHRYRHYRRHRHRCRYRYCH